MQRSETNDRQQLQGGSMPGTCRNCDGDERLGADCHCRSAKCVIIIIYLLMLVPSRSNATVAVITYSYKTLSRDVCNAQYMYCSYTGCTTIIIPRYFALFLRCQRLRLSTMR